jgi:hypothetical protein
LIISTKKSKNDKTSNNEVKLGLKLHLEMVTMDEEEQQLLSNDQILRTFKPLNEFINTIIKNQVEFDVQPTMNNKKYQVQVCGLCKY